MPAALRILLTLIALGALGLAVFLLHQQERAGITLKPFATYLMYGGFAVGIGLLILLGVKGRAPQPDRTD